MGAGGRGRTAPACCHLLLRGAVLQQHSIGMAMHHVAVQAPYLAHQVPSSATPGGLGGGGEGRGGGGGGDGRGGGMGGDGARLPAVKQDG